jgi:hypothetical protein
MAKPQVQVDVEADGTVVIRLKPRAKPRATITIKSGWFAEQDAPKPRRPRVTTADTLQTR